MAASCRWCMTNITWRHVCMWIILEFHQIQLFTSILSCWRSVPLLPSPLLTPYCKPCNFHASLKSTITLLVLVLLFLIEVRAFLRSSQHLPESPDSIWKLPKRPGRKRFLMYLHGIKVRLLWPEDDNSSQHFFKNPIPHQERKINAMGLTPIVVRIRSCRVLEIAYKNFLFSSRSC